MKSSVLTKNVELYKIRTHRTPLVCLSGLLAAGLLPSVVLLWYRPAATDSYVSTYLSSFDLFGALMAVVFGSWLLGTEFRQDTAKRMFAAEPRRLRAVGNKAATGLVALLMGLIGVGFASWAAARVVGSMNDIVVPWAGREIMASVLSSSIIAIMAFGISAITRSDSFAMLGSVSLLLVLDPMLTAIPKVGRFSLGSAVDRIVSEISHAPVLDPRGLSAGSAWIVAILWLAVFLVPGAFSLRHRDI